jgi:hypothetical protein
LFAILFAMRLPHKVLASLALAPSLLLASSAHAALTVKVTPGPSAGQSIWTFSGSSTYTELTPGGKFAGGDPGVIEEWKGDGGSDYVKAGTYNNYTPVLDTGSIGITVTPQLGSPMSGSIDGLHIDHDNSGDDFGVSLLGADIPLSDGATVSWSGSGTFPVDFANLNVGIFQFTNYGEVTAGQPYGTLPVTIDSAPGPLPLLGCGAAFSFSRKLRRACKRREMNGCR